MQKESGVRSQESRVESQESEGRRQKAGETFLERATRSDKGIELLCRFGQHVGWERERKNMEI